MKKILSTLAVCSSLAAAPAWGAFSCTGQITFFGLDGSGAVTLSLGSYEVHRICALESLYPLVFSIKPTACKAAYDTLLQQKSEGKPVTIWYYGDSTVSNCSAIQSWSMQPTAYFVQLN
ncbi:hypothetical protein [Piscinibacter koreensis]|uniref:Uncharacterized protein n=1 Tax=Piscinibacter koreensis TaxID=2742824 RepID=A0A7Y6NMV8_9BURK|nr:hypothetical protein [Schlegelella koreensis]NUZ06026.1 hypothetical protein [Schlegelella koreensis]